MSGRAAVLEVLVDPDRLDAVWSALRDGLRHVEETTDELVRFHDTFDWRLWSEGVTLEESLEGSRRRILRLVSRAGVVLHRQPLGADASSPTFASTVAPGALRQWLETVIEPRRLLPVVELRTRLATLSILDDEEKTVVRVDRLESTATVPDGGLTSAAAFDDVPVELRPRIRLRPVRGYDDAFATLRRRLGEHRLDAPRRSRFEAAVAAVGRVPGEYTSKPRLELDPKSSSADAARRIHRHLLDVLRANEDGTRRNLDSEFLHDFRVAVRRTRSALSQIKGVFPPDHLEHFKNEFRWLGRVTGPTRDLDVYLLKMPAYRAALPEDVRADLEPLERHLVERQRAEQAKLAGALESSRYRKLLADWQSFLDDPPEVSATRAPHAERPIRQLASERIWTSYRRVLRAGLAIEADTPDAALHDLRIDCKKLRYLLEFFRSLYPPQEIDAAVKALKRLQDVLGDFNDYSVQQESMRELADGMATRADDAPAPTLLAPTLLAPTLLAPTLLAMGRLVAHLESAQHAEREQFAERMQSFASKANQARFRALFR